MNGWMGGWMSRMDGCMDGSIYGWMDRQTNRWTDKWMHQNVYMFPSPEFVSSELHSRFQFKPLFCLPNGYC